MGRRKGSKNKKRGPGRPKLKFKKVKAKGKRGRPKGSKNKNHIAPTHNSHEKMFAVPKDYIMPKKLKFLGYCSCGFMINESDKTSMLMYECPGCGKKNRISKLKKEIIKDRPKTKKEYLEETVFSTKLEGNAPSSEEHEIVAEVEEVVKEEKDDEIK